MRYARPRFALLTEGAANLRLAQKNQIEPKRAPKPPRKTTTGRQLRTRHFAKLAIIHRPRRDRLLSVLSMGQGYKLTSEAGKQ